MDKVKLYMRLRMITGIVAACGVVATFFIFVLISPIWWGVLALVITLIFVGLCFWFRRLQRAEETRLNPPPPTGDFITGRVPEDGGKDDGKNGSDRN